MSVFNKDDYRPVEFGDTTQATGEADTSPNNEQLNPETHKPNKDRARKRIQQLSSDKRAAEAEAANYKKLYEEAMTKSEANAKVTATTLKTTLDQQYQQLLIQMREAISSGDADKVVNAQDSMFAIKLQLDKLNNQVMHESVRPEAKEAPVPRIPDLAKMWIEDHPAFKTDELFHNACITVNNQLLREGYDAESEEFYDALSARLQKRFPESFGVDPESVLNYKGDDSTIGDSEPVVKAQTPRQVRTSEQTVSGPSRPSANTIRSSRSPNSQVTFTQQEAQLLDSWGLDKERVAQRLKYNEAHRQDDGYVPIIIPRK